MHAKIHIPTLSKLEDCNCTRRVPNRFFEVIACELVVINAFEIITKSCKWSQSPTIDIDIPESYHVVCAKDFYLHLMHVLQSFIFLVLHGKCAFM